MINADMRLYDYYLYEDENDYGQKQLSKEANGKIKMSINLTSQNTQENINYKNSQYIGLTLSSVNDSYVIQYGDEKLKVLYVNPKGRYTQVFMSNL